MSLLLSLLPLSLLIHTANAFNITEILNKQPDFSTFNSYLTQTNLAAEINGRETVTVLALDNGNAAQLSGKPMPLLRNILAVHVILDYYDGPKILKKSNNSIMVTTLFQTTGVARNNQGFLNLTRLSDDGVVFGSAVPGSTLGSTMVKPIDTEPYGISVLQVSSVIIPEGIDGSTTLPPPGSSPPAPAKKPGVAPAPTRKAGPPSKAVSPSGTTPDAPPADKDDPAAKQKTGAGTALHISLAIIYTMVGSTIYLASRI